MADCAAVAAASDDVEVEMFCREGRRCRRELQWEQKNGQKPVRINQIEFYKSNFKIFLIALNFLIFFSFFVLEEDYQIKYTCTGT